MNSQIQVHFLSFPIQNFDKEFNLFFNIIRISLHTQLRANILEYSTIVQLKTLQGSSKSKTS